MTKFPVTVRQMTPNEMNARESLMLAMEAAGGDKDRVVMIRPGSYLVVNKPGFDPNTWRKSAWKDLP